MQPIKNPLQHCAKTGFWALALAGFIMRSQAEFGFV
jgi:hypothetical protein